MSKKEEEFKYITEEDYKTLISIYQQKTFELFNQNIALEAKVSTLNSLVEKLTSNIAQLTKSSERTIKKKTKFTQNEVAVQDDENKNEETFD